MDGRDGIGFIPVTWYSSRWTTLQIILLARTAAPQIGARSTALGQQQEKAGCLYCENKEASGRRSHRTI